MKKLFTIIAVAAVTCLGSLSAAAQETTTHLTVNLHDGTTEHYKLLDEPTVKMVNHQIVVSSPTVEGTYDFEKGSHFSFEQRKEETTEISDSMTEDTSFAFSFIDNATVIISAPNLEWVNVFNVGGVLIGTEKPDSNHVATLDVSILPAGTYIIAPSCHSAIKIVKR